MAMQVTQSNLAKKFGGRLDSAVQKHAHDETDYGFQKLPGGIKNGVAQLTKCYFDQYKKGKLKDEYYLRCEGVVVSPIMTTLPDGSEMKVAGLTTSIMRPLCDIKDNSGKITATVEDNAAIIMNEFRKLGAQTTEVTSVGDFETIAAAIQQSRPFFKFTTTETYDENKKDPKTGKPYPPRVWENWYGTEGVENYTSQSNPVDAVQDDTVTEQTESNVAESSGAVATNGHHGTTETKVEYTDQGDIESIFTKACEGDSDAQKELQSYAERYGVLEQVNAADTWEGACDIVRAAMNPTAEEPQSEETPAKPDPAPKMMYKYKPQVKAKDGKMVAGKKAVDVEVLKVDKAKRTAEIKNMVDGKTKYVVSWDELE